MPTFDTLFSGASKTTRLGRRLDGARVSDCSRTTCPRDCRSNRRGSSRSKRPLRLRARIDELADRLRSGSPVTVNTTDAAAAILHTCGLSRR